MKITIENGPNGTEVVEGVVCLVLAELVDDNVGKSHFFGSPLATDLRVRVGQTAIVRHCLEAFDPKVLSAALKIARDRPEKM